MTYDVSSGTLSLYTTTTTYATRSQRMTLRNHDLTQNTSNHYILIQEHSDRTHLRQGESVRIRSLHPVSYPYDFQHVTVTSLCKDTSAINFHEDSVGSFYVKLLKGKQTDRQTNKRRVKHSLLVGGRY